MPSWWMRSPIPSFDLVWPMLARNSPARAADAGSARCLYPSRNREVVANYQGRQYQGRMNPTIQAELRTATSSCSVRRDMLPRWHGTACPCIMGQPGVSQHQWEKSMFPRYAGAFFCGRVVLSATSAQPPGRSGPSPSSRPSPPGGIADVVARLTAERLQSSLEAELRRRECQRRRRHGRTRARRQGSARRLHADVDADLPAHHGEVRAECFVRREHASNRSRRSPPRRSRSP